MGIHSPFATLHPLDLCRVRSFRLVPCNRVGIHSKRDHCHGHDHGGHSAVAVAVVVRRNLAARRNLVGLHNPVAHRNPVAYRNLVARRNLGAADNNTAPAQARTSQARMHQ